eukprot:scaffold990_cov393-Prasinococcus_capsulatus_cf.AAC.8
MEDAQSEAVLQFVSITGAEAPEARSILESCAWNLEQAVELHYSLGGAAGNGNGHQHGIDAQTETAIAAAAVEEDYVRPPDAVVREALVEGHAHRRGNGQPHFMQTAQPSVQVDAFRNFEVRKRCSFIEALFAN